MRHDDDEDDAINGRPFIGKDTDKDLNFSAQALYIQSQSPLY